MRPAGLTCLRTAPSSPNGPCKLSNSSGSLQPADFTNKRRTTQLWNGHWNLLASSNPVQRFNQSARMTRQNAPNPRKTGRLVQRLVHVKALWRRIQRSKDGGTRIEQRQCNLTASRKWPYVIETDKRTGKRLIESGRKSRSRR